MKLGNSLIILGLLMGLSLSAQAREPAVEDFVGVETEGYAKNSPGTEVLFEFENSVKALKPQDTTTWQDYVPGLVLGAFLFLPFAMWTAITRTTGKLASNTREETSNNVTNLADYANDAKSHDHDEDDDFKQAG